LTKQSEVNFDDIMGKYIY